MTFLIHFLMNFLMSILMNCLMNFLMNFWMNFLMNFLMNFSMNFLMNVLSFAWIDPVYLFLTEARMTDGWIAIVERARSIDWVKNLKWSPAPPHWYGRRAHWWLVARSRALTGEGEMRKGKDRKISDIRRLNTTEYAEMKRSENLRY